MRFAKYQSGMTIWSLMFTLFLLGFTTFTTIKLFPAYAESMTISGLLENMADEPEEYMGALSVRVAVQKRLQVNSVDVIGGQDVLVTKKGPKYYIEVDYEVIVPYIGNISLLLHFNHTASVRASGY